MLKEKDSRFGKKRLADFYLDPDYVNVNHGSFGSCPRVVMEAKRKLEEQMDYNGEKWFRGDSEKLLLESRTFVANRVKCKPDNLFIVQNATDAINSLVKSLTWEKGDTIVLTNMTYSCVKKTIDWLCERYGVKILSVNFLLAQI